MNDPSDTNLQQVMANILRIGRVRPIVIQSLFPMLDDEGPSAEELLRTKQFNKRRPWDDLLDEAFYSTARHKPSPSSRMPRLFIDASNSRPRALLYSLGNSAIIDLVVSHSA